MAGAGFAPREEKSRPRTWANRARLETPQIQFQAGQPMRFPRELLPLLIEPEADIEEPGEARRPGRGPTLDGAVEPESKRRGGGSRNRLLNDPTGDPGISTQSENSIAASGRYLVAGWNDQFDTRVPRSFSGFGYSSDGGNTWTDGGTLPPATRTDFFFGDPSLTVDGEGNFYYASLYSPDGLVGGISVSRGRFDRRGFSFRSPVMTEGSATDILDKEWIAADPANGYLYVTYTRFLPDGSSQIELQRSRDRGRTWSAPLVLTDPATSGVQGSRPVVGPSHEVYVVYFAVDLRDFSAHMRIRKSTNSGRSFGPEANVGEGSGDQTLFVNTVCGPPGFNRTTGVAMPSIAVDRNRGPHRGSVYVTWPEAVNFFDDPLGGIGVALDDDGNDTPAGATPIDLGVTIVGELTAANDADWYSFQGRAGQTVEFLLLGDGGRGAPADGFLRLFCRNGELADRLALSYFGDGTAFVLFTLPSDGKYLLRVLPATPQAALGDYAVFSGIHQPQPGEVGRDANDVVLTRSRDGGKSWSRRARVNHDAARFDNSFSEVAVDGRGDVHVLWYDHRNDRQFGILSDVYRTRSEDGGRRFGGDVQVNDGPPTNWNLVSSNFAPNMGDYIALVADGSSVYANWADGRLGSPDSWFAAIGDGRGHDRNGDDGAIASSEIPSNAEPELQAALRVPNPVRHGTPIGIELTMPRTGIARLDVFSVTGQRVRTLLDGEIAAGARRVVWDARGASGERVPAGVYFVALRGADLRLDRRVVIVP
jgi:hypothetical protein